jgi:hypothetical protein
MSAKVVRVKAGVEMDDLSGFKRGRMKKVISVLR